MSKRKDEEKSVFSFGYDRLKRKREIPLPHIKKQPKNDNIKSTIPVYSTPQILFLRDCVSRVTYNSGSDESIRKSTESAINYLMKNNDSKLISNDPKLTELENAQMFFRGKRIIRMVISPEDEGSPIEKCVSQVINYLEGETGQKIYYVASLHRDTDHTHAHMVISREDGGNCSKKNPLIIDKTILISGARNVMKQAITSELGFLKQEEYYKRFEKNVDELASAKIDYKIAKTLSPDYLGISYNKLDNILKGIPIPLHTITKNRLDNLVNFGGDLKVFKDESKKKESPTYRFENYNWQEYLRSKEKSKMFEKTTGKDNVLIDNYNVVKSGIFEHYDGVIKDKKIVDYDKGRIAFLIQNIDDHTWHYAEEQMYYDKFESFKIGTNVRVYGQSAIKNYKNGIVKKQSRIHLTEIDPNTREPIKHKKEKEYSLKGYKPYIEQQNKAPVTKKDAPIDLGELKQEIDIKRKEKEPIQLPYIDKDDGQLSLFDDETISTPKNTDDEGVEIE